MVLLVSMALTSLASCGEHSLGGSKGKVLLLSSGLCVRRE
jgi:hypothetical protein